MQRPPNQFPARLFNQGGNTVAAIPRAICRQLGLLPRTMVIIAIDNGHVVIYPMEERTDGATPIRRATTRPAP